MKLFRIVTAIIVIILAGYGLISGNDQALPFMMFFLGVMMLVTGIAELQGKRKGSGLFSIIAAAFVFTVTILNLLG